MCCGNGLFECEYFCTFSTCLGHVTSLLQITGKTFHSFIACFTYRFCIEARARIYYTICFNRGTGSYSMVLHGSNFFNDHPIQALMATIFHSYRFMFRQTVLIMEKVIFISKHIYIHTHAEIELQGE